MKKNLYFVNILFIIEMGLLGLVSVLLRSFAPAMVLPHLDLPHLVLFSVIPMIFSDYMAPEMKGHSMIHILLGTMTLTALPLCAQWTIGVPVWKFLMISLGAFGMTWVIYQSIGRRMASGVSGRFAPLINGVMLFLASQCFQGLF